MNAYAVDRKTVTSDPRYLGCAPVYPNMLQFLFATGPVDSENEGLTTFKYDPRAPWEQGLKPAIHAAAAWVRANPPEKSL